VVTAPPSPLQLRKSYTLQIYENFLKRLQIIKIFAIIQSASLPEIGRRKTLLNDDLFSNGKEADRRFLQMNKFSVPWWSQPHAEEVCEGGISSTVTGHGSWKQASCHKKIDGGYL